MQLDVLDVLNVYQCPWWPLMQLAVLDVYLCTSCSLMHQNIYWDDQDNPHCTWVSWMLVVNKLSFEAPLGFIWMPLMQLDVLDVYGCPRWPTKQLDVLELHWCIRFALMHQGIYMDDQDDPWCIWILDVYFCTSCVLMHQGIYMDVPDNAAGCL